MSAVQNEKPIVFFDGVCGLCDRFVNWLLKVDRRGVYRVATLQGQTASKKLGPELANALKSVVLWSQGLSYQRSDAVLRILGGLGGFWRLAGILLLVPRPIRDAVYDWIARNRYRWFGKKDVCRMPTVDERSRFLE